MRVLFVFAWLAGGQEEHDLRLLAQSLDRTRFRIDAIPCLRLEDGRDQTHQALTALGVRVDCAAYGLSLEDTVTYLARKVTGYEIVVACQGVPDIYPALESLHHRPPLIEHGACVAQAQAGPKHLTSRYVGTSPDVTAAAAARMPQPEHARTIPPMLDMSQVQLIQRRGVRDGLGFAMPDVVIGWHGRAEALVALAPALLARHPTAHVLRIGPPGAQVATLRPGPGAKPQTLALADVVSALDLLVIVSRDTDHSLITTAGAARVAVVTTEPFDLCEPGTALGVAPTGLSAAIDRLVADPGLRQRLGDALHARVASTHASEVVCQSWVDLFDGVLARTAAAPPTMFQSFVQGGFEASSHRLRSGRRLDVIAATSHDTRALADYRQLSALGLRTLRDGLRWHLIEQSPGRYDFASFMPMMQAAQASGAQVIWDLMHYGWPDDIDIWTPAFVTRFAAFARATARLWHETTDAVPFWCPVNEVSFFAWAGGDVGYLNPFATGRGLELKVQLARASIAAMQALREVDPRARFVQCEPLIAIHPNPGNDRPMAEAQAFHAAQFEAHDMLAGRSWPQIGGAPEFLDILGVNYYPRNQWLHQGPTLDVDHPAYRPLSDLLFETYARYGRPLFIAETGVEDHRRAPWFRYVAAEVERARQRGVPVEGICLYPVLNHPGWDDDRLCHNGLLTFQDTGEGRGVDPGLAAAVAETVTLYGRALRPRERDAA